MNYSDYFYQPSTRCWNLLGLHDEDPVALISCMTTALSLQLSVCDSHVYSTFKNKLRSHISASSQDLLDEPSLSACSLNSRFPKRTHLLNPSSGVIWLLETLFICSSYETISFLCSFYSCKVCHWYLIWSLHSPLLFRRIHSTNYKSNAELQLSLGCLILQPECSSKY